MMKFSSFFSLRKKNKQRRLKRAALRWISQMPMNATNVTEVQWKKGIPSLPTTRSPVLLSFDLIGTGQSNALLALIEHSECHTICFAFRNERPCSVQKWVDLLDQYQFHRRELRKLPWPFRAHIAFAHRTSL